jgi:hypothetical protein
MLLWSGAVGGVCAVARRWRSAPCADSAAMLGQGSWRPTRFAHCVRCAQTDGAKSVHEARCARRPQACASRRHPRSIAHTPPTALPPLLCSLHATTGSGPRRARSGGGARGEAPRSAEGTAGARRALRELTGRRLSERSERSERSELGGPAVPSSIAGCLRAAQTAERRAPLPARARLGPAPREEGHQQ